MKHYFENVKAQDKVFGLIFGPGVVRSVWEDSFYHFEVEYKNGHIVPYTVDGIPGWNSKIDFQTVYYKEDIDIMKLDMIPADKVLTPKKIIKLRDKKRLEIRCPSGIWQSVENCPNYVFEEYIGLEKYHLFRKAQKIEKS